MSPRRIKTTLLVFFAAFFILIVVQSLLNARSAGFPVSASIDILLFFTVIASLVCILGLISPNVFGFRMQKPIIAVFGVFFLLVVSKAYANTYGTLPELPEMPRIAIRLPEVSIPRPRFSMTKAVAHATSSATLTMTAAAASAVPAAVSADPQTGIPVALSIPAAHIEAKIEKVGVTASGEMEAPTVPEEAGWYSLGPRPGMKGLAIILGHSGWVRGRAVAFDNLHLVKKGDTISITDEAGKVRTYHATEVRTWSYNTPLSEMLAAPSGDGIALMTCAGDWDKEKHTYKQRLVVFAREVTDFRINRAV